MLLLQLKEGLFANALLNYCGSQFWDYIRRFILCYTFLNAGFNLSKFCGLSVQRHGLAVLKIGLPSCQCLFQTDTVEELTDWWCLAPVTDKGSWPLDSDVQRSRSVCVPSHLKHVCCQLLALTDKEMPLPFTKKDRPCACLKTSIPITSSANN